MAQGEFTKAEAKTAAEILNELFDAIPKSRRGGYVGHLNDLGLFIDAAGRAAPETAEVDAATPTQGA